MIYGCVIVYNDAGFLEGSLQSLKGKVDRIVVVDGAYAKFPHEIAYSTDKSLEIARKLADIVIETKNPWATEQQKRNSYLLASPGDYYFVLDADEKLEGDLSSLSEEPFGYEVTIERGDFPLMTIFRCFKHQRGLHYYGTHHALWLDGVLLNNQEKQTLSSGRIIHLTDQRTRERVMEKGIYYRDLLEAERSFRSEWKL